MSSKTLISRNTLSRAGAERLLAAGLAEAARRELKLAFAVVDAAGHLLAFTRMDGANLLNIEVCQGKARTAALVNAPSSRFAGMIEDGRTSMLSMPGLVSVRGGIPVHVVGQLVGAVGVSGSTGENDEEVAEAMVAAFAGQ